MAKPLGKYLVVCDLWSDLKAILTALLLLCTFATVLQLAAPLARSSTFFHFHNSLVASEPQPLPTLSSPPPLPTFSPPPPPIYSGEKETLTPDGAVLRSFDGYGSAAHLFIRMGAYRGGSDSFAVVGLASKPLQKYAGLAFTCRWIPSNATSLAVDGNASYYLPDWDYGRVYSVVVVNCSFPSPVGVGDASGGSLILTASTQDGDLRTAEIPALVESPGSVSVADFTAPPKYEYLYCGSSLYGSLSPRRMREWMAYHVKLFGPGRAHFVFHDAGGVHPRVLEVLRPWMELGYVTLQDIRAQERFDGYYHNQFMVVNDCLHRYRFAAKWIFFFDVDEYIYVPKRSSLDKVMKSMERHSQFTIDQMPMSSKICLEKDKSKTKRMWGIEKLVFRDVKKVTRRDRKYAMQPRTALTAGVHMSQHLTGSTEHRTVGKIMYYHYHGSIALRRDPCEVFTNSTSLTVDGTPYVLDDTLRRVAGSVKKFEFDTIGDRLVKTPKRR